MFFLLTGHRIGFGNFLALPAISARRVANMGELWLSLPATVLRSRIPITNVPTERGTQIARQLANEPCLSRRSWFARNGRIR